MKTHVTGLGQINRRTLLISSASVAAVGMLGSCAADDDPKSSPGGGGEPKRGGVLTFAAGNVQEGETLDPATASGPSQYILNVALFDTLVYVDGTDWSLTPRLAEKWSANKDITEWTFTLRSGVTFHDGRPLTAADVAWTLGRIMDPKVGSNAYSRLARTIDPQRIEAVDDTTLVIGLTEPDSLLPYAFGLPQVAIIPDGTDEFEADSIVGTGPYSLDQWTAGESWEVVRNVTYWDTGLPYLDGMRKLISADTAAAAAAVQAGDFDVAEAVDYASAARLQDSPDLQVVRLPNAGSLVMVMDTTQEPFTDERVRDAFKLAVDRSLMLKLVYQGYGDVTGDLPIPPDDPYYPTDFGVPEHDPEGAAAMLAEAGYADGIDVELLTGGNMTDLAVAYADSVAAAGIRVTLKQYDLSTYWGKAYLKAPFYMTDWQLFFPPDYLWYTYGSKSSANESKLELPDVDAAYDECLQTLDAEEQRAEVQHALGEIADKMGHIIPVSGDALVLASQRVQGIEASPAYRVYLRSAWLSE